MATFLQETIDEHRKNFDPSNLRDLLDTYLMEIHQATEEGINDKLFEGRDHGKSSKNCHNFKIINDCIIFLFRSSNATNYGWFVLCWYGNDQVFSSMGCALHAAPSWCIESCPRGTRFRCWQTKTTKIGRYVVSSDNRINYDGSSSPFQYCTDGNHARTNKVSIISYRNWADTLFLSNLRGTCEKSESRNGERERHTHSRRWVQRTRSRTRRFLN